MRLRTTLRGPMGRVDAERRNLAAVAIPEAFEDLDCRRLASAVRAEQREYFALLDVERDVAQQPFCRRTTWPRSGRSLQALGLPPVVDTAGARTPRYVERGTEHDDKSYYPGRGPHHEGPDGYGSGYDVTRMRCINTSSRQ